MSDTEITTQSTTIKNSIFCSSCGASIAADASVCPHCGSPNKANPAVQKDQGAQPGDKVDGKIVKSRAVAGLLGIFLGGFGIHKFYCGSIGLGVVYLIFFWTFIPAIIGFIEGIIYITQPDDESFTRRYCI
jgi:hypothetical protein